MNAAAGDNNANELTAITGWLPLCLPARTVRIGTAQPQVEPQSLTRHLEMDAEGGTEAVPYQLQLTMTAGST